NRCRVPAQMGSAMATHRQDRIEGRLATGVRRWEFIVLLGGAAITRPLEAGAQQSAKPYRIAVVHPLACVADMGETGDNPYSPALFKELSASHPTLTAHPCRRTDQMRG